MRNTLKDWHRAMRTIEDRLIEQGELERLPDGTTRCTDRGLEMAAWVERQLATWGRA